MSNQYEMVYEMMGEFIDKTGIVVPFPNTASQQMTSILGYIKDIEKDLFAGDERIEQLEAENAALRKRVEELEAAVNLYRAMIPPPQKPDEAYVNYETYADNRTYDGEGVA